MISSYDLLDLGFSPKYEGFKLLLEVVNSLNESESVAEAFRKINPEHPGTVEKNIRVCVMNSNSKYKKYTIGKVINDLRKEFGSCNEATFGESKGIRVKFEKVSFKQFKKDVLDCGFKFSEDELLSFYEKIRLPRRATTGSAGYDFYAPFDLIIEKDGVLKFPTGIKCYMDGNVVLQLFPRSGLGFKYGIQLYNTCGIIDSDYALAKNEGHIHCKMHFLNENEERVIIGMGNGYMQGIFLPFIKTVDDSTQGVRVGGFGSTNGKA